MTDPELRFVVVLARQVVMHRGRYGEIPKVGDLVVEVTKMQHDPDAIGFLVGHGESTSADMVPWYDIKPISGRGRDGVMRWENCQFVALPAFVAGLLITAADATECAHSL